MRVFMLFVVGALIALFTYVVLTVPMIAMTGPTLIWLALVVAFVLIWRSGGSKGSAATREP